MNQQDSNTLAIASLAVLVKRTTEALNLAFDGNINPTDVPDFLRAPWREEDYEFAAALFQYPDEEGEKYFSKLLDKIGRTW